MVVKWVQWFKKHRAILESDVIHLRRADARDLDGILHVNPSLSEKGMAVFYNPATSALTREVTLPLHYPGLRGVAHIRQEDGKERPYPIGPDGQVHLTITVKPQSRIWLVVH